MEEGLVFKHGKGGGDYTADKCSNNLLNKKCIIALSKCLMSLSDDLELCHFVTICKLVCILDQTSSKSLLDII